MNNPSLVKFAFSGSILIAAACALAATSAKAQDYGAYGPPPGYQSASPPGYQAGYQGAPPEQVEVIAPRFRGAPEEKLNGPLEKVSLSTEVPYNDLDLRTRTGAHQLRMRVREAARNVCAQLADAYPVYQLNGTHCYREALENAVVRANSAITSARVDWRQSYYDAY